MASTDRPACPHPQLRRRDFLAGSALVLGGCKKSSTPTHPPGVAVVVPTQRSTWIRNFNPFFESQCRWPAAAGIYEPCIIFNRVTGSFVPWLAELWYWEDAGLRLVLKIRKGVRWRDGRDLTPKDVAFTFSLMKKFPALDQSSVWRHLEGISIEGQLVHFRFRYPFILPALFLVGRQAIVPAHIWERVRDPVRFSNPHPVGTGPFTEILTFKPQVYEVGANPDYWQPGKPGLSKFHIPAFGGNESLALAIIHGEIDWAAGFIPAIDRIFVGKDPKHRGYFFPSLEGTVMLYANTQSPPFDRIVVRKAMSHALNRDMIVRIAMQGYTRPADATGFSDLFAKYHDPRVLAEEGDFTVYDPRKANEMLDAAGLLPGPDGMRMTPDKKPFSVDVNCVVGWSDWIIASEIMVRNLRSVGIDATLRTYAYGAWFDKLRSGRSSLSIGWSDAAATPYSFYQNLMSKDTYQPIGELAEHNWQRFVSDRADQLLTAFAASSDPQEQWRISSELQREFVRKAPAIPIFPGPTWGQFNTRRVEGFPHASHAYAPLAPYKSPGQLLAMVELRPAGTAPLSNNPGEGAPGAGWVKTPPSEKQQPSLDMSHPTQTGGQRQ